MCALEGKVSAALTGCGCVWIKGWKARVTFRSVEPVFRAQAGDFIEIHEVAREQRGAVSNADGADFQTHRAGAHARVAEAVKGVRRRVIKGQDREFDQRPDAAVQPAIGDITILVTTLDRLRTAIGCDWRRLLGT
jgi:hypothetical protein